MLTLVTVANAAAVVGAQARLYANNVQSIIVKGSSHWLIDEAPDQVVPALISFIN